MIQKELFLNNFLKIREENLRSSRINFIELDSINLMDVFKEETFDLIWVDGDHSYPTVEKDINNSYLLLKKGGYIVIDDVSKINIYIYIRRFTLLIFKSIRKIKKK